MKLSPTLALNDGHQMPQIGLGVYLSKGGDEVTAVASALEVGYRHIDTAAIYKNEEGVGQAIAASSIPRNELFITTKCWNDDIRAGNARQALETSLEKLKLDYVDLYLLHWHVDGGIAAWEALEQAQADGLVRSIGVSNYMPEHIDALTAATSVVPAVNQVEFHPHNQQQDVIDYCAKHNIAVTAWSPLMQGKFLDEPLFAKIGEPYGKTAAQVLLRWDIERGVITIPKSVHANRISENFDILDFSLTQQEVASINALASEGSRLGPDPRNIDF